MEETRSKVTIDNLIKYLTMFMIIFVSVIVVTSILMNNINITGIVVGTSFIFLLVFLKWAIKESGME